MGQSAASPIRQKRVYSIDLLRGVVLVVMALDHTRDFFSGSGLNPTDLTDVSTSLFVTRWITHYCAPVFVFLAGTGAFMSLTRRQQSTGQLARFLMIRGLWLVFLELGVVHLAWSFDLSFEVIDLQVIWAIGLSMIILAGLVYLPLWVVGLFAIALIAGHNLLDSIQASRFGAFAWLWMLLHEPGTLYSWPSFQIMVIYPLIPWVGVMAVGYVFGRLMLLEQTIRNKRLLTLGLSLIAVFVLLRASSFYGDPTPWVVRENVVSTLLDFVNCEKYPPSLLYLLMTLGPAIAVLPVLEDTR